MPRLALALAALLFFAPLGSVCGLLDEEHDMPCCRTKGTVCHTSMSVRACCTSPAQAPARATAAGSVATPASPRVAPAVTATLAAVGISEPARTAFLDRQGRVIHAPPHLRFGVLRI